MPIKKLHLLLLTALLVSGPALAASEKPRIIVTSDAEIDDQCSLARFLLYANEWDIEGIITSSSQYRWQGHKWPGDDWYVPYLEAYAQVHPNLIKHDPSYPTYEYLRSRTVLGNAKAEGDLEAPSPGSELIVRSLLDASDPRPVWLQAWGGANTIARALKTIEEEHPERMAEVAAKCRLFLIWEQDETYQSYIRPAWVKYGILTIIADQFEAIAYRWKQAQPAEMHRYFEGAWMRANILRDRGPLTALYHAHENGDFRSEGDSPAFLHTIPNGLRSMESPGWGGWGGRYVRVRENTWLDAVPVPGYNYPEGRWYGSNGWGRNSMRPDSTSTAEQRAEYFKPMWRWTPALQNDFAARAAWCVLPYDQANHPPVVTLAHPQDLEAKPGALVRLSAQGSSDPDADALTFRWWRDSDADTVESAFEVRNADSMDANFTVPLAALPGQTVHLVCEVTDAGTPPLTRYRRVVVTVDEAPKMVASVDGAAAIPPMVARFSFDAKKGNQVLDTVNGLSGDLVDAEPDLIWVDGVEGKALRLDGRSSRVVVPSDDAIDFGSDSFSISFWMRWPRRLLPGHQRLLAKGDYDPVYPGDTGRRYELFVDGDSLCFAIDDNATESRLRVPIAPYVTGEWIHVAAARDREAGRLRLYANGQLLATSSPGNPALDGTDRSGSIANARPLVIGNSSREDAPFHGDFDDLRFFRSVLTPEHVAAIAARVPLVEREEEAVPVQQRVAAADPATLPPLAARFPLTEGEGGAVNDSVSDKGLALRLDGVDDRVEIPASPGFDFKDESFTVAFHVRWTKGAAPRHEHILCKGDYQTSVAGESGKRWEINLSPRGLSFIVDDDVEKSQIEVPHATVLDGQWHHIVAIRDTQNKRLKLLVDGKPLNSTEPANVLYNGVDRTGDISNPRELIIGDSSRRDNLLPGELADIRIYRAALTDAQAAAVARLRRGAASNPAEITHPKP